jgi:predicted membrane protein
MRFFLFSGAFWGIFLIAIGAALMAKYIFNLDFPIGRIIWSVFLIMLGVQFLIGFSIKGEPGTAMFSDTVLYYEQGRTEYQTIFGKGYLDLSEVPTDEEVKIKAVCVFGEMVVKVNDSASVSVKGSSVFGNAQMPGGSSASFGDVGWRSTGYDRVKPTLKLKAESVFGQISVIR